MRSTDGKQLRLKAIFTLFISSFVLFIAIYILISCCLFEKWGVDYFNCGAKGEPGRPETGKDAERGELSQMATSWGAVHSTLGSRLNLPAKGKTTVYYWMAAGTKYDEVVKLNQVVYEKTPEELIKRSLKCWKTWVSKEPIHLEGLPKNGY